MARNSQRPRFLIAKTLIAFAIRVALGPPTIVYAHDTTPVYVQSAFRGRNDDGNETTATWKANENTNWTQLVDTTFRVRFELEETASASPGEDAAVTLQYNLNGAGYVDVSESSNVVRSVDSANFSDADATTNQLTTSARAFTAGEMDDADGTGANGSIGTGVLSNEQTEFEFAIQIRGVDVTDGNAIQLRIRNQLSGLAFNTYTNTPSITVSKPAAPKAPPPHVFRKQRQAQRLTRRLSA